MGCGPCAERRKRAKIVPIDPKKRDSGTLRSAESKGRTMRNKLRYTGR